MLNELETKRNRVAMLLNAIIDATNDYLVDDKQKEVLEDAKWSVLGYFDAEISYTKNMLPKIEMQKQIRTERIMKTIHCN